MAEVESVSPYAECVAVAMASRRVWECLLVDGKVVQKVEVFYHEANYFRIVVRHGNFAIASFSPPPFFDCLREEARSRTDDGAMDGLTAAVPGEDCEVRIFASLIKASAALARARVNDGKVGF